MQPFRNFTGLVAPMDRSNVDTDQVIPKQFLKAVVRSGLGKGLFFDWRDQPDKGYVLDQPRFKGATILVARANFGCGSSREHAVWALADFGFKAAIATSFADIFRNNALKNGLLPVVVEEGTAAWLIAHPGVTLTIDVARCTLTLPDTTTVGFPLEAFARHCLLEGVDELGFLVARGREIDAYEARA